MVRKSRFYRGLGGSDPRRVAHATRSTTDTGLYVEPQVLQVPAQSQRSRSVCRQVAAAGIDAGSTTLVVSEVRLPLLHERAHAFLLVVLGSHSRSGGGGRGGGGTNNVTCMRAVDGLEG